jgi:hypothetical protein
MPVDVFKQLDQCVASVDLQDLAAAFLSVGKLNLTQFIVA